MTDAATRGPGSGAVTEIVRRVLLLAGVLGAIWCATIPARALIRVRWIDFATDPPRRWAFVEDPRPLEERTRVEVADRLFSANGAAWTELARAAEVVARGEDPPAAFAGRRSQGWLPNELWFRTDEPPVADAAAQMDDTRSFLYVPVPGETVRFLGLTFTRPAWAGDAPRHLAYPHRAIAPWLLLAGILAYALLPHPRFAPTDVRYVRFRGTILPDVLGVLLTGVFFALPLLVVPHTAGGDDWTGEGWIILWCVGWGMALFGVAIHAIAARYAALRIEVLPDRLRRTTLRGTQELRFDQIECARFGERTPPKGLIGAGILVSLLNWRAAGPTLLVAARRDAVLDVVPRGGGAPWRIDPGYCVGVDGLLDALRRAGTPLLGA